MRKEGKEIDEKEIDEKKIEAEIGRERGRERDRVKEHQGDVWGVKDEKVM